MQRVHAPPDAPSAADDPRHGRRWTKADWARARAEHRARNEELRTRDAAARAARTERDRHHNRRLTKAEAHAARAAHRQKNAAFRARRRADLAARTETRRLTREEARAARAAHRDQRATARARRRLERATGKAARRLARQHHLHELHAGAFARTAGPTRVARATGGAARPPTAPGTSSGGPGEAGRR